jgi:hypothetical protein
MSFPRVEEIEVPLLLEVEALGGEARPKDVYLKVAAHFAQITEQDMEERTSSGGNRWENLVQWAKQLLVNAGELERFPRGLWRITPKGRERIKGLAPPVAEPNHEQLQSWLKEIGEILGRYAITNYNEGTYRYDIIWKPAPNEILGVTHAFEVQDRGNLNEALIRLQHALDRWNPYLFLVITGERDWHRAERLLNLSLAGSFHRLRGKLQLLSPPDVQQIRDSFVRYKTVIEKLVKER